MRSCNIIGVLLACAMLIVGMCDAQAVVDHSLATAQTVAA